MLPIYEFRCTDCGEKFEEICVVSERSNAKCPKCGSSNVSNLISRFGYKSDGKAGGSCAGCTGGNCGSCGH